MPQPAEVACTVDIESIFILIRNLIKCTCFFRLLKPQLRQYSCWYHHESCIRYEIILHVFLSKYLPSYMAISAHVWLICPLWMKTNVTNIFLDSITRPHLVRGYYRYTHPNANIKEFLRLTDCHYPLEVNYKRSVNINLVLFILLIRKWKTFCTRILNSFLKHTELEYCNTGSLNVCDIFTKIYVYAAEYFTYRKIPYYNNTLCT